MARTGSRRSSDAATVPRYVYGAVVGAVAGTAAVLYNPMFAGYMLAALMMIATYAFFVIYLKAVRGKRWSPAQAVSAAPIMGALVVGVMAVSGAQYLGTSSATSVNGNVGSIISTGSCDNLGSTASGNIGSIVRIDGNGTCDVNQIMQNPAISGNVGSIIIIDNACGDVQAAKAKYNIGSIVKVTSVGPCQQDQPTTVIVQPADAPLPVTVPTELPQTGTNSVVLIALIAAVTGYLFSAVGRLKVNNKA